MKLLLVPRNYLAFGQDFQIAGMKEACGMHTLPRAGEEYRWPYPKSELELVVTQNPEIPADSRFIARLGRDVPVVAHLHRRWASYTAEQQECVRETLSHCAAIVVPAAFLRSEMEALFPRLDWYIVPNGVRVDLFRPTIKPAREDFRQRHLLPKHVKLVGFTGRLERAKGLQVLEAICTRIENEPFALLVQFPNWKGIREQDSACAQFYDAAHRLVQINPRKIVIVADDSPRADNRPIRHCDVCLGASFLEVQPLSVLEALASGVPVIATESTPAYAELSAQIALSAGGEWVSIQPLPEPLAHGAAAANQSLADGEISNLAGNLIARINEMPIYDDRPREVLSSAIVQAGLTEAAMHVALNEAYGEIVRRFRQGADPKRKPSRALH